MILVTGGFGFIGAHAVRALLDCGEACVVARHRTADVPELFAEEVGRRVVVEPLDLADRAALMQLGRRHRIHGIVHLAAPGLGTLGLLDDLRLNLDGWLNLLQAAQEWGVHRVSVASSIGVYGASSLGAESLREDMMLPMTGRQPIETNKKAIELLGTLVAKQTGTDVVHMRFSAVWGPLARPRARFFAVPQLVHAAVRGAGDGAEADGPPEADQGIDLCYVRDGARAVALLQTAPSLRHRVYNVGSGRVVTNRQVAAAIRRVIPQAEVALAEGSGARFAAPASCLDITRLRQDTGFEPLFDVERGVADYVAWLRAGHAR